MGTITDLNLAVNYSIDSAVYPVCSKYKVVSTAGCGMGQHLSGCLSTLGAVQGRRARDQAVVHTHLRLGQSLWRPDAFLDAKEHRGLCLG